ncbi:ABC transporter substrate-binding protein [Paenibacillus solisilvae]|uniref:ABC transporter substrate-binding protein n=1 Tax=Paenibacillus solisilvae TaxID=2486751 RepID=A0ABW0W206_9BACL
MKKMNRVGLMLMSCILVTGLAACGGGNNAANTNGENAPANAPANTPANAPADEPAANATTDNKPAEDNAAAEETIKKELAGRTIKISAWWDGTPKPDSDSSIARIAKTKEVEAKYGVKIEYVNVPFDQYQAKFTTTVLAGQPFADIVRLQYDWALVASLKDQLLKLNDYTNIDDSKLFGKAYPLKGEDYGFDGKNPINDQGVFYNRDLFKKLGLTDPQEIFDQGNWTWDTFEDLAKKATQDTNNDGKPDTYGWSGWNFETAQFLIASNGSAVSDDVEGKEMISDPKTIEALDFLNKMYNVDHVVKVKKGDVNNWEERVTFGDGDVAMTYAFGWLNGEYKGKKIDYGYVPFPKGPQATDYVNPVTGGGHAWFIPKGVKNPDLVMKIYEEINDIPTKEEYPGQEWLEQIVNTPKDIELIQGMAGKVRFMNFTAYPGFPFADFVGEVTKNKVPAATAAEKFKQPAQAAMDKILKAAQ